jgi:histidinol-phosphate aminotransferase
MASSRRSFLRTLGAGAAAGTAVQWPFSGLASGSGFEPTRPAQPDGAIHLNNNENVYGPSEKTVDAIRAAVGTANRYPFRSCDELTERIAGFHGVKPEQVILGCGSTEILRVTAQAFLGGGKTLLQTSPTFEAIEHYAQSTGAEVLSLPLTHQYGHDLQGMLERANASATLVYICNPNNPTATLTPRKDLEDFIAKLPPTTFVLIDEAYHHYAGVSAMYASFLDRPVHDERVIVSRTFSKVYGMSGLRLGYGIASPETAQRIRPFSTRDNANGIVARAAMTALDDQEAVKEFVRRNDDDRQEFYNQCHARMLRPIDSHANFVMMDTHRPAKQIIEHFRQHNVLIGRRFPAMDSHIRVSLGTPPEMLEFWRVWDLLPHVEMSM